MTATRKRPIRRNDGYYKGFTAPWYRGDFDVGDGTYFKYGVTAVIAQKTMRNLTGVNRMRATLAGFYDHEPRFCRAALDYMLVHSDTLMTVFPGTGTIRARDRRRREGMGNSNAQSNQPDAPQQAGPNPPATTPPEQLPPAQARKIGTVDAVSPTDQYQLDHPSRLLAMETDDSPAARPHDDGFSDSGYESGDPDCSTIA